MSKSNSSDNFFDEWNTAIKDVFGTNTEGVNMKDSKTVREYLVKFYKQDYMIVSKIIQAESLKELKSMADGSAKFLMDEHGINEVTWTAWMVVIEGKVSE